MTMTVQTSRFGAWRRGLDTFAAQLLLLERDVDACDLAAAEAALGGDDAEGEGDPDGDEPDEAEPDEAEPDEAEPDEQDEQDDDTDEPDIPAAIAH